MSELSTRLKKLRIEKQLSREELANALQISYWTIAKYETGERNPDNATLARLADFFGVSVDYLLGRIDEPKLPSNAIAIGDLYPVPIIGRIHAGEPISAVVDIEGYEPLPVQWLNDSPENYFLLRVVGDSMEQARIYDGDLALITQQAAPSYSGQICAICILTDIDEPCAVLRRVYELDEQYLELVPANDKYPRQKLLRSNVMLYGVLKRTIREYK